MLPGERLVGGLTCSQVLEALSAYLDGELEGPRRTAIEAHVSDCQNCARFGISLPSLRGREREHLHRAHDDRRERLGGEIGVGCRRLTDDCTAWRVLIDAERLRCAGGEGRRVVVEREDVDRHRLDGRVGAVGRLNREHRDLLAVFEVEVEQRGVGDC